MAECFEEDRSDAQAPLDLLRQASVAAVSAILLRRGLRNQCLAGVRPIDRDADVMVGPAFTLRLIPAREDIDTMSSFAHPDNVHRQAIELCPPGAVLVVDARGCSRAASAGDLMARRLRVRGCAGMVTDGGFRDAAGIAVTGLPAYQGEPAPCAAPAALHAVDTGRPIGCAGVAVYPDDIVMGDGEGVIVIPADIADAVAREAFAASEYEGFAAARIAGGARFIDVFPPTESSLKAFRDRKEASRDR